MNKSRYVFFILACLFGLYVQAQNRTVKGAHPINLGD